MLSRPLGVCPDQDELEDAGYESNPGGLAFFHAIEGKMLGFDLKHFPNSDHKLLSQRTA